MVSEANVHISSIFLYRSPITVTLFQVNIIDDRTPKEIYLRITCRELVYQEGHVFMD